MIGTIDIKVNAANPQLPLAPVYAFVGSPSQIRVSNVPRSVGAWKLTKVYLVANSPDNVAASVEAKLTGGIWSATLPASTSPGQSLMGFKIVADGVDENGAAVTGYILGKGDFIALDDDSTVAVGETTYYVHIVPSAPATPKKGDLALDTMMLFDGTAWVALGGGGGDISHEDFAVVDAIPAVYKLGDVAAKVNEILTTLKGESNA